MMSVQCLSARESTVPPRPETSLEAAQLVLPARSLAPFFVFPPTELFCPEPVLIVCGQRIPPKEVTSLDSTVTYTVPVVIWSHSYTVDISGVSGEIRQLKMRVVFVCVCCFGDRRFANEWSLSQENRMHLG